MPNTKKQVIAAYRQGVEYATKTHKGFMCKTDYDHELGVAMGGVTIYPSVRNLKENRTCIDECGIVEVEVRLVTIVQEADYSAYYDKK